MLHRTLSVHDFAEISAARRFVREHAAGVIEGDRIMDVELAASELVTNAIEHAMETGEQPQVEVSVDVTDTVFHLAVSAPASQLPQLARGDIPVTARQGRGLFIVSRLCDSVAVSADQGVVSVSCRFDLG